MSPLDDLSPRQREIAEMVTEGLTNAEIAERLYCQPKTVASHLAEIYHRMHITTRNGRAAVSRVSLAVQVVREMETEGGLR